MSGPGVYAVGEIMPGWRGPRTEGPQFQIDSSGATLLHYYRDPTPREIRGAKEGRSRFGLVAAGEHTMFLIYNIAGLTKTWSDAPFALGLVSPHKREIVAGAPHQGRLLLSMLINAVTGIVLAVRGISLTPDFSATLDRLVATQRAALSRFTAAAHDRELQAAYARWPDADAMVGAAAAIECGGLPFRET